MKAGITTRGITYAAIDEHMIHFYTPKAGDVALFQVQSIGKHDSIQNTTGNNSYLFEGDQFLGVFGSRYATEQFEGYVPESPELELEILGKGGVVGKLVSMHVKLQDAGPTIVKLVGFAVDAKGKVVNSIYNNKAQVLFRGTKNTNFQTILSLGCSMDSGKTTTAAYLCRSLQKKGHRVAFIKLTGTYYTRDRHFVNDCGADYAIDFGMAGYPSTHLLEIHELLNLYQFLIDDVARQQPDYVVIEIADGILQRETEMLLNHKSFASQVDDVVFSGLDSLSVLYAIDKLSSINLKPKAICGVFTMAPLLIKEVSSRTEVPVLTLDELEKTELFAHSKLAMVS